MFIRFSLRKTGVHTLFPIPPSKPSKNSRHYVENIRLSEVWREDGRLATTMGT